MSPKFVVSHLDQQIGPFTEQELKTKWSKGELLPIDYVYDELKKDWILLAERFEWAAGRSETAPPPLKPVADKKKTPPAPTPTQINVPHLNLPQSPMTQHKPIETTVVSNTAILNLPAPETMHTAAATPAAAAPKPAPAPAPAATAPVTPVKQNGMNGAKIKIVDGVGQFDLPTAQPGQVELVLQDSSNGNLKLEAPLKIQVRPLEPEEITWSVSAKQTVGQDLEIVLKAVDGKGTVCTHCADEFTLQVEAFEARTLNVKMVNGQATMKVANTKAENWNMALQYKGVRKLRLPQDQTIEWQPGPAARLILDGPPELVAGNPLKVQVKAVDQFGNLAKTFQGTVILEVKAS